MLKTRFIAPILASLAFTPAALADGQAIAPGATISGAQVGHAFFIACRPRVPALMEKDVEAFATTYGWSAEDLGTDLGYISPEGGITLTLDGNPIEAVCDMSMVPDLGGGGTELYDSLVAHAKDIVDDLPDPEPADGGFVWKWSGSNASFTLELYEGEAVSIRLTSES